MIDIKSYVMGYEEGTSDGEHSVVIESGIICTDEGNGNIVIEEA